jgi:hypothetical protein
MIPGARRKVSPADFQMPRLVGRSALGGLGGANNRGWEVHSRARQWILEMKGTRTTKLISVEVVDMGVEETQL